MTVTQLVELLQDVPENAEVLIATQPHWPLQHYVYGITTGEDLARESRCEAHGDFSCEDCVYHAVIWLVAGDQVYDDPYAPRGVWEAARRP